MFINVGQCRSMSVNGLFNVTDGKLYLAPEKRVQIW